MQALDSFAVAIVNSYGTQLEIEKGIFSWNETVQAFIKDSPKDGENQMFFGRGEPNESSSRGQYIRTFGQLKETSASNGYNAQHTRRLTVAHVYSLWELTHRAAIASEVGIDRAKLLNPLIGDLRILRNCIMHVDGKLDTELTVLSFLKKGDVITFTDDTLYFLFFETVNALNVIARDFYKQEANYSLDFKVW